MKLVRALAPTVLILLAAALGSSPAAAGPVVVELFQSQGCSSCPPANANLLTVVDRPDVIALSFNVTYWDSLGWKDTFAQARFTARQWDYAHALRHSDVFTPQIVVDGRRDGVGADRAEFMRLVRPTGDLDGGPSLGLTGAEVRVGAAASPASVADVWLVRFDPRTLQVPIRAGENGGKTLTHRNVVRALVRLGRWSGPAETLRLPPATDPALRTAVIVQLPGGGPILAAVKD
ncbi:MAG TPA: DUF1223 domain-containing protein [Caulobacteraceae bacterium]|nr:DUF1223 domain-containing protein [Caulobacteraceae bacterium]